MHNTVWYDTGYSEPYPVCTYGSTVLTPQREEEVSSFNGTGTGWLVPIKMAPKWCRRGKTARKILGFGISFSKNKEKKRPPWRFRFHMVLTVSYSSATDVGPEGKYRIPHHKCPWKRKKRIERFPHFGKGNSRRSRTAKKEITVIGEQKAKSFGVHGSRPSTPKGSQVIHLRLPLYMKTVRYSFTIMKLMSMSFWDPRCSAHNPRAIFRDSLDMSCVPWAVSSTV